MSVVCLDLFKKHVRADDFGDDDAYLQHLLDTAQQAVITATNRSLLELIEMGGGEFPTPLRHAVMMLGAHWYNQRESVAAVQMYAVPDTLQALVKPFRKLADDASR